MNKIAVLELLAACVLMGSAASNAQMACCRPKVCRGQFTVPGPTPADARCCNDPSGTGTCTSNPNVGWECNSDLATDVSAVPARQGFAGCIEIDGEFCFGGASTSNGVDGCIDTLGLQLVVSTSPSPTITEVNFPLACQAAAVDACCAAGACVLAQ
jgi:hypothetical protein